MNDFSNYLIDFIQQKNLVDADVIKLAIENCSEQRGSLVLNESIIKWLYQNDHLNQITVARLLGDEFDIEFVNLESSIPSPDALKLFSVDLVKKYQIIPVDVNDRKMVLATYDPLNTNAVDDLSRLFEMSIELRITTQEAVRNAIELYFGQQKTDAVQQIFEPYGNQTEVGNNENLEISGDNVQNLKDEEAPIISYVHSLISRALKMRASDIHIEPLEKRFRIRFRIDGALSDVENPPKRLQLSIVSRIKLMAQMSIAEKRLPQDGRIQVNLQDKEIDLRVSTIPTVHGESIVMRILDKEGLNLGLPELGFFSDDQVRFEKIVSLPDGILLVVGPTGSGKSTTLYACLNSLNKPDRKIITVEDPVEYQMNGINQVQVKRDVNMTFSSALRAMLRQAPNIIMVGEIRDLETAEIAVNASLTGHMVFSTLHTNDAPGAVTRLTDIGVKPFLVASSLRGVLAQRLIRTVCPNCKEVYTPNSIDLRNIGISAEIEQIKFYKGSGCQNCSGKGFYGRKGIFEFFEVDEDIQKMIHENSSLVELRKKARQLGMRTLREDGIRKVVSGMTTIDEVMAVTLADDD